jgi:hypothetical protein
MLRAMNIVTVFALVGLILVGADAAGQDKAAKKKKKTDAPTTASYSKVASVDPDKKNFTLSGDDTTYTYTDTTPNRDKITVGAMIKVTLKDGSKTDVTFIEPAPSSAATPKKKKTN